MQEIDRHKTYSIVIKGDAGRPKRLAGFSRSPLLRLAAFEVAPEA